MTAFDRMTPDWRGEIGKPVPEMRDDRFEECAAPPIFIPTPFVLRPASEIPPRQSLYGRHLTRGMVSTTVGPGGLGKSSLLDVERLAMATGRALLGDAPISKLRVWGWNGEDPRDELERRIGAACLHYGIDGADLGDRLLIDSGRDLPITLAAMGRQGVAVARPLGDALIGALREAKVDVLTIDPLVASHQVIENDNGAMNAVVAEWRRIADAAGCAVELVHHVSKAGAMNGDDVGIYAARGAGALIDGVRSARYLVRMQPGEAERFGVEDAASYFRVAVGKANLAPPDKATWRKMVSVPLGNGAGLWQAGDHIGVCAAWTPPDAFDDISLSDLARVQAAIIACAEPPAHNERAANWAGCVISRTLGLDAGDGPKGERTLAQNASRAKVRSLIGGWIKSGALVVDTVHDSRNGRAAKIVAVGEPAYSTGQN